MAPLKRFAIKSSGKSELIDYQNMLALQESEWKSLKYHSYIHNKLLQHAAVAAAAAAAAACSNLSSKSSISRTFAGGS
jgi:hypothetical protein